MTERPIEDGYIKVHFKDGFDEHYDFDAIKEWRIDGPFLCINLKDKASQPGIVLIPADRIKQVQIFRNGPEYDAEYEKWLKTHQHSWHTVQHPILPGVSLTHCDECGEEQTD